MQHCEQLPLRDRHVGKTRPAGARIINLAFFATGMATLGLLACRVGLRHIASQIVDVGAAFWLILVIEFLSNAASCRGWFHTFEVADRPSYSRLLLTGLASLSVGSALPSGQAGEIAKANLLRGYVKGPSIISSLLLWNCLHMLSTCLTVVGCSVFGLATGVFPWRVSFLIAAIGVVLTAATVGGGTLLRSHVMERGVRTARGLRVTWLRPPAKWLEAAAAVDCAIRRFNHRELVRVVGWLTVGRLLQVLEVYVVLVALGLGSSPPEVAMIYAITAVANYLLMVLPARDGFLEGSSYIAFGLLGLAHANGLSFELVRRLRKVVFQVIGMFVVLGLTAIDRRRLAAPRDTDAGGV